MVDNENLKNGRINIYLSMAIAYIDSPLSNKINMVHDPWSFRLSTKEAYIRLIDSRSSINQYFGKLINIIN